MAKHRSDTYFVLVDVDDATCLLSFRALYSHFPVIDNAYFGCLIEPDSEQILDCCFHEEMPELQRQFELVLNRLGTITMYIPSIS